MANAPAFDQEVDHALEGGKELILDLSEATFIDSSVISVPRGGRADHPEGSRSGVAEEVFRGHSRTLAQRSGMSRERRCAPRPAAISTSCGS